MRARLHLFMLELGVNIDHVATLRQARYAATPEAPNAEPDLVAAASACERAGARGITVHLRADRRHIQDRDVPAPAREHHDQAQSRDGQYARDPRHRAAHPAGGCLPRPREPQGNHHRGRARCRAELQATGADRPPPAIRRHPREPFHRARRPSRSKPRAAAARMPSSCTPAPLPTPPARTRTANCSGSSARPRFATERGLQVNAGHGINYTNIAPHPRPSRTSSELNIGHSIVSRALFAGLEGAVREMVAALRAIPRQ